MEDATPLSWEILDGTSWNKVDDTQILWDLMSLSLARRVSPLSPESPRSNYPTARVLSYSDPMNLYTTRGVVPPFYRNSNYVTVDALWTTLSKDIGEQTKRPGCNGLKPW
jgi:hypothetical protein